MNPKDQLQRPLRDLRISVTDRCNFRCRYCMPREVFDANHNFLPRKDLLTYEEISRFARLAVSLGVEKIRLTGGEPLLRRDLPDLIRQLVAIEGLQDVCATTNGVLLTKLASELKDAGLARVTVSLDSLDDAVFRKMNDAEVGVDQVLKGLKAAQAAGLGPVKI
ncbi:MAG: radical SAM protein, partial [Candidatus Eisenbacteria bacterium]|nr:radical SAM protein [Candidatus Eisenbacteria bacterium]